MPPWPREHDNGSGTMGIYSEKTSQSSTVVDNYYNKIPRSMDISLEYSDAMITGRRGAGIIIIRTNWPFPA